MKTRSRLLSSAFVLLTACGGDAPEEAPEPQGPPVATEQVPELSTGELLGLDRENIMMTTPWRAGTVTRSASDVAPAATQRTVEAFTADGFDRLLLGFAGGTPAPGYRIGVPSGESEILCGEETTVEGGVLIRLSPALLREEDGEWSIRQRDYDLGFPVVTSARLLCEGAREAVWHVETAVEAVEVRVVNLTKPERIAIDLRPGDLGPQ
jgi:hypothetical protein